MKKRYELFVLAILFSIFLLNFVSAYYYSSFFDLRQGSEQVIQWAIDFGEPFLRVFLGGDDWSSYLLFEKFLLFILFA